MTDHLSIWENEITVKKVGFPEIDNDRKIMEFISITEGFVTSSLAYIGQTVTGLGPLLYMVIGVPLGFYVIRKVLALVPKR